MTRFTHSILFFFALSLALLCSAVLMLFLQKIWANAGFVGLVVTAMIVALVVPAAGALASLRWIKWRQPVTAWAIFYLITVVITLSLVNQLLG